MSAVGKLLNAYSATVTGTAFGAVLACAGVLLSPSGAEAQSYYSYKSSPSYGYYIQKPRPVKPQRTLRKTPRRDRVEQAEAKAAEPAPAKTTGPLTLVVSIKKQRVNVYDANGFVTEAPISSGRVGYATPTGIFTILEKNKVHFSNLYDSAPMPNMQRITWSGVALHAGDLPGYPASHGCIRLPRGFSSKLFELTKVGNRVIVTGDQPVPQRIVHDRLFAAVPQDPVLTTTGALLPGTGAKVADASGATTPAAVATSDTGGGLPVPAKRSAYREKWLAEMAAKAEGVKTAEENKLKAAEFVGEASKAVEDAKAALKAAREDAERFATAARKAKADKIEADRKLAAFAKEQVAQITRTSAREPSPEELQKIAEMEDKLEAATYELGTDAQAASEDEVRAAEAVKQAAAALADAQAKQTASVVDAKKANTALLEAIAQNEAAKRREAKRHLPVSVFVSRKEKKLFVRQGYEPIFETPVTIDGAEQPIGTHVFTALAVKDNQTDVDWSVVSLSGPSAQVAEDSDAKRNAKNAKIETASLETAPPAVSAQQALDRITIPEEARAQIEDVMKTGSSLIISDHGISKETGKFTDFIVLTSGGGSGGSKKSSNKRPSAKPAKKPETGGGTFFW